jgi:DNA-directed RNA polymerase subunit RPC12/RpoP
MNVEIESLSCNNCGAPLDVPSTANFLTCRYCGSRLVVRRTETAHYTELVERLEDQAEYLRLRDDLDALDEDWQRERRRYLILRPNGTLQAPTRWYLGTSIVVGLVVFGLTGGWFYASANAGPGAWFFGWFGAIMCLAVLAYTLRVANKVGKYNKAKQAHQQQRRELMARLYEVYPQERERSRE